MVKFSFSLTVPKKHDGIITEDIYFKDITLTKNKSFEIQFTKFAGVYTLFTFDLDLSIWGRDHAGGSLELALFNYTLILNVYDHRHWNHDENRWMTDAEAEAEEEEWKKRCA